MGTCCEAFCKHGNVFLSMQNLARLAEERPQGKEQEAQLSQRGRAMPRVVEYFG